MADGDYTSGIMDILPVGGAMITNADTGVMLMVAADQLYLATTTGTSVSVVPAPALNGVTPVLQAQDGSYYGTSNGDQGPIMVAFDASGNIRWSVPNETPMIATADGGVIANAGYYNAPTTFYDQNGNATGQVANLPTQSWRGNMYRVGSIDRLASSPILMALSLWAQTGGNPSRNSTASRPWYFRIKWQNQFSFIPDFPNILDNLKIDISYNATRIKDAAKAAFQKAYDWPVTVFEGDTGGDRLVTVQTAAASGMACGNTPNISYRNSEVYYECVMKNAQFAVQARITNAQDEAVQVLRPDLIQAIGRGVGDTAAHEIAHQFLGPCCSMDVLTSADPNAAATYNNGSEDGDSRPTCSPQLNHDCSPVNSEPATYTGFGKDGRTAIHWEDTTRRVLHRCIGSGWVDYPLLCRSRLDP